MTCPTPARFHTVLTFFLFTLPPRIHVHQAFPRFREFIIFHGEYIYPEYVIAYQRYHNQQGPVG